MKRTHKALLLTMCAIMLVVASALGTIAYLTDTDAVQNTFTVGSVGLELDEATVNPMGEDQGTRWQPTDADPAQEYHLLPGHEYTKDPTVTVDAGSEEAYVRMMVTITYDADADAVFAKYGVSNWLNIDAANWIVKGAPETTRDEAAGTITRTYEFRYKEIVAKSENATKLPALFATVSVPGAVTNAEIAHLAGMSIDVVAHAIQVDGFDTDDVAWAAFEG